ncbi:MAG: hypothetical protein ABL886_12840, partial [Rhodoglobus sp.]
RGTAHVTLTGVGSYASDGELTVADDGYYAWVWRIAAADQSEAARSALGDGYLFVDRFGLEAETVRAVRTPELAATGMPTRGLPGFGLALLAIGALAVAARREYRVH